MVEGTYIKQRGNKFNRHIYLILIKLIENTRKYTKKKKSIWRVRTMDFRSKGIAVIFINKNECSQALNNHFIGYKRFECYARVIFLLINMTSEYPTFYCAVSDEKVSIGRYLVSVDTGICFCVGARY